MGKLKLGVMAGLVEGPDREFEKVYNLGLPTCQLGLGNPERFSPELALEILRASEKWKVEITACWPWLPGQMIWNFTEGPLTIGLVPPATRLERVMHFKRASDFARRINAPALAAHMGFIPENPNDPEYGPVIEALQEVAVHCRGNDQDLLFETGQETPITLLRAIRDVGVDNLGINLDPANLLMYGKANPIDALGIIGPLVGGVHAKDGEYPSDGRHLGLERPLGEGQVNFPILISKLKSFGFTGALTIEREIRGPEQTDGIKQAIRVLQPLL